MSSGVVLLVLAESKIILLGLTFLERSCQESTAHLRTASDYSRISRRKKLLECIGGESMTQDFQFVKTLPSFIGRGCLQLRMSWIHRSVWQKSVKSRILTKDLSVLAILARLDFFSHSFEQLHWILILPISY